MGRILSTIFADHFSNPTKPQARRRKQAQAPRLETLSIAWDGNNGFRRCWRLGWSRRGSASAVSWSLPRARARKGVRESVERCARLPGPSFGDPLFERDDPLFERLDPCAEVANLGM